jgi:hypothetical protein
MDRGEEYFARTLRLRPIIEADAEIMGRIAGAFRAVYDDRLSGAGPLLLSDGLIDLGSGTIHNVIGLGKVVTDPETGTYIHLAVRLNHRFPYSARHTRGIFEQVGMYNYAFEIGQNPPYFVGVVTAEATNFGRKSRKAGILMEDVSKGKTLQLRGRPYEEVAERVLDDRSIEGIFLDPGGSSFSKNGELYLRDEARIDLQ